MKILLRWGSLWAIAAVLLVGRAVAGTVSGRVTDAATELALGGVRVTVAGTPLETYTSPDGSYTLLNVPEGERLLEFGYVGYPEVSRSLAVGAGHTRLDVAYGEATVELERFVIEGALVGSARAINQQRAAGTLTNIVAADEIGRFPDQNAAESLQRIPGISLYRDQGEGRYVVLRGLNYTFTSVKVNGGSFAGADLGERATALDVIPADALAAIEVTKVPTPDKDGEGLGGQVNIKTKSPFDRDGLYANFVAQGQYSSLTEEFSSKFNGTVSTRWGDRDQYGLLVAPTWQKRKFGSHNYETGGAWTSPEDNDTPFYTIEELGFRDYTVERERYGVAAAWEARPDEATSLFLRANYNRFTDTEARQVTIFDFTEGDLLMASADSASFGNLRRFGRRLRLREKDQEVTALVLGGSRRHGAWNFDAQAGYTKGVEKRPDELEGRFRRNTRDAIIGYTTSGAYGVSIQQLAGASFLQPASYDYQRVDLTNEEGEETEYDLGFNARYEFADASRAYVKFGALLRNKEKESSAEVYELDGSPSGFTFASLAGDTGGYPFLPVPRIRPEALRDTFYSQRAAFTGERIFADSEFDDFEISERILAAYLMGGASFDQLSLIAGVRVERTAFETTGQDVDLDAETSTRVTSKHSYNNWLPGIHLRYDASKNLVFRASWSHALARPAFGDAAYRRSLSDDDREITVGNPGLAALEATNWDASVEYYLPSLGVLSAAVFYKDIKNFSYEYTADDPVVINGEEYELTTFANGSSGSIFGLELAYEQRLRFLPAPFDGFGLLGNLTLLDSEATYPTRPHEDVPFVGQSDYIGNVGLTYEKGRFFGRLALNFRSERLREDEPLGGSFAEDLYVDDFKQLDFTLRYRLTKQWECFAEFLNLTDEPFRVFLKSDNGQGARLGQWEEYGWSANFGVRWGL